MRPLPRARKTNSKQRGNFASLRAVKFYVAALASVLMWCAPAAWCVDPMESGQDSGSKATEYFGNGAEINVIVHDGTGNPISSTAMVRLFRDGNIPSGEGATSHGRVRFVVTSLGEFTVLVEPAGQPSSQKEVSVRAPGETQVDVFLRPGANGVVGGTGAPTAEVGSGAAGKMILAPKAQEAFDKGLRALSAEKMSDAEKFVGEAAKLAPGHPDVLYAQGVLYLKEKKWSEAQTVLEKATQIDPSHARAYAALGMALTDQGKFEASIAPLTKSIELDGATANWETEYVLARGYYESAKYPEALAMSQKALGDSKGRAPEIMLLVAQALTANGQYTQAEQTLKEFLRDHGDRPEAAKAKRWVEKLEAKN